VFSLQAAAMATAHIQVTGGLPGDLSIDLNASGHQFAFDGPVPITLAPGQVIDTVFSYTVTVSETGSPVGPSTDHFCTPLHDAICDPTDTGFEQVLASFSVGYRDPRAANTFISVNEDDFAHRTPADGTPESFTQSGTFHLHIVNTDTASSHSDTISNWAVAFVDSSPLSPIPEPTIFSLMLAGLGAAGIALRRKYPVPLA